MEIAWYGITALMAEQKGWEPCLKQWTREREFTDRCKVWRKVNKSIDFKTSILIHWSLHTSVLCHLVMFDFFATLCTLAHQASLFMGFFQTRILEWVAMLSSKVFSWPGDWTHVTYVSCITGIFFTTEPSEEPKDLYKHARIINGMLRKCSQFEICGVL